MKAGNKANDYMKCAFCDWKTRRWTTDRRGKRKNGGGRLLDHVQSMHPDEYVRIKRVVDAYRDVEEL